MEEFEAVFAKHINRGGPVVEKTAEEYEEIVEGISKEGAKELAKDMKKNIK
jgi:hypothetical protein